MPRRCCDRFDETSDGVKRYLQGSHQDRLFHARQRENMTIQPAGRCRSMPMIERMAARRSTGPRATQIGAPAVAAL